MKRFHRATTGFLIFALLFWVHGTAAAFAAEGEVNNLRSTSHTVGVDSKTTEITMAWDHATKTGGTLNGYSWKFSTSQSDIITQADPKSAKTTSTTSDSFTGQDGTAYYFHIRAVFTVDDVNEFTGLEAGEDYWGPEVTAGPYRIDDTAPTLSSVAINGGASVTNSINVTLTIGATGATKMTISNAAFGAGEQEDYAASRAWTLNSGDGTKTVYVQVSDNAGNTAQLSDQIELNASGLAVSADSTTVTEGTVLTFDATGGTPDYTWEIINEKDDNGEDAAGEIVEFSGDTSGESVDLSPKTDASGTCQVRVTDSADPANTATSQTITVTRLTISPVTTTVANSGQVDFEAENGTPPYTFSIVPGDTTDSAIVSASGLFTASSSNTGSVTVRVTDDNGITEDATVTVSSVSMAVSSGGNQSGKTVGTAADNLAVQLSAAGDKSNYIVVYEIKADPTTGDGLVKGSLTNSKPNAGEETTTLPVLTDGDGKAAAPFFVGSTAGSYQITAACTAKDDDGTLGGDTTPVAVSNSPVTFQVTAVAGAAETIEAVSGNNQTGTPNTQLDNPFVVKVTDDFGNGVSGVTVTFTVTDGSGKLSGDVTTKDVVTGSDGRASITFTPGSGTNTVTAAAAGLTGSPVTFTAEAGKEGDANGDELINGLDALYILNVFVGNFAADQLSNDCDVDDNGSVNSLDALYVLNFFVGNISDFDAIK